MSWVYCGLPLQVLYRKCVYIVNFLDSIAIIYLFYLKYL